MAKWLEKEVVSPIDGVPPIEEWQSARCSACGKYHTTPYMYYFDWYKFCPNCGAAMDGKDEPQIDCETCKHKHDGTVGYCKTCGESNYEPKDELQTDCQWK